MIPTHDRWRLIVGVDDEGPPLVIVATVQFSRTAEEATPPGFGGSVSQNSTACDRPRRLGVN